MVTNDQEPTFTYQPIEQPQKRGAAALPAIKAEKLKKIKAMQPLGKSKHKINQIICQTGPRSQNE